MYEKISSNGHQIRTKMVDLGSQIRTKTVHLRSKMVSKYVPGGSKHFTWGLGRPKTASRASKSRKRRPKGAPNGPKTVPKVIQKRFKKHVKIRIDFEDGFSSISGRFWAPKSTNFGDKNGLEEEKK